jgi:hypothetical protein
MLVTLLITGSNPATLESAQRQTYSKLQISDGALGGDAFLRLKDGDILHPHAVATLVQVLEHNQGVSFAYAPAQKPTTHVPTYEDGPAFLHQYFRGRRFPEGSSLLMRTHLVRQLGGYPSHYQLNGDRALWLRLALQGWVGSTAEPLVTVAPRVPASCLDTLLHEEFQMLAEAMAELGRDRRLPNRMAGMCTLGRKRISDQLLQQIRKHPRRQRKELVNRYSRYWGLRHALPILRLLVQS